MEKTHPSEQTERGPRALRHGYLGWRGDGWRATVQRCQRQVLLVQVKALLARFQRQVPPSSEGQRSLGGRLPGVRGGKGWRKAARLLVLAIGRWARLRRKPPPVLRSRCLLTN